MDETVKGLIVEKLEEWGPDESITVAKLAELRDYITKKTGKHKFLPYTNLRKWVREVKKEMKITRRKKKTEKAPTVAQPPSPQRAIISPFADRVFFQNFTYELTTMRKTLERISKQLDELERQVQEMAGKEEN